MNMEGVLKHFGLNITLPDFKRCCFVFEVAVWGWGVDEQKPK